MPFSLRVDRHGYPPERPLTVRVIPENLVDPEDIFPLEPPGLSTTGLRLVGEETHLVNFRCGLHYPCFVGAHNDYHASIHDGARLLWDSRWRGSPLGRATVAEAPLAHLELVGLEAASCADRLSDFTEGTLHLRLYARNPYHGVPMDDVVIELPLPAGLTVFPRPVRGRASARVARRRSRSDRRAGVRRPRHRRHLRRRAPERSDSFGAPRAEARGCP